MANSCICAGKSKSSHNVSINHVPLPHSNSVPSIKDDKLVRGNFIAAKQRASVNSKPKHDWQKNCCSSKQDWQKNCLSEPNASAISLCCVTENNRCVAGYSTLSSYLRSFCLLNALVISRGSKTKKRRPLCWNQGISCSRGEVMSSFPYMHYYLGSYRCIFIINPRMHSIVILLGSYYAGPFKISASRSQGSPSFFFFSEGGFRLIILQNVLPSFHLTNIHMNLQVCCSWKRTILGNIQCKLSQNNLPCYAECPNCPSYVINLHWLNIVIV